MRDSRAPMPSLGRMMVFVDGENASDGEWTELRWTISPGTLPVGSARSVLSSEDGSARFEVDHLLVIPLTVADRSSAIAARKSPVDG